MKGAQQLLALLHAKLPTSGGRAHGLTLDVASGKLCVTIWNKERWSSWLLDEKDLLRSWHVLSDDLVARAKRVD